MGECSSLPQPPDLSLDQLERVKDSGGGDMCQKKGQERREILSQEIGREFLQPDSGAEGGRVWLLLHMGGGRGRRVWREGDEIK